jgi:Zn-dependent alcohol dehydrogenase
MKTNAAILWEQGTPLSVEDAELEAPRAGEGARGIITW